MFPNAARKITRDTKVESAIPLVRQDIDEAFFS
jgi:hypothetical protein